jgi:hypothetical protein
MKVKRSVAKETFNPVDLTITFESEEELLMFYSIHNYSPIVDSAYPKFDCCKIRDAIGSVTYGDV